jgi:hypothetical protein
MFVAGCGSDGGTSPSTTTHSTASFILNGSPYSNTSVELRDNAGGIWLTLSTGHFFGSLDVLGTFGATITKRVILTVTIPGSTVGSYDWIDPQGGVLSNSGVFLQIHDQEGTVRDYRAVQGSTILTAVGAEAAQVDGTFSGSLRAASDGGIITISNGVFSLTRLSNQ